MRKKLYSFIIFATAVVSIAVLSVVSGMSGDSTPPEASSTTTEVVPTPTYSESVKPGESVSSAHAREMAPDAAGNFIEHNDPVIIDLRDSSEFLVAHIPGAVSIPFYGIESRMSDSDFTKALLEAAKTYDRPIFIYDADGKRVKEALPYIALLGYKDTVALIGGVNSWEGSPLQPWSQQLVD